MNWFFIAGALGCGVVLTTQVAANKQLGDHLHNAYIPALANMVVGLVATIALLLALTRQWPSVEMVKTSPWYGWIAGGVLGVAYLTGTILLSPKLGAATLIGLVVTGQIVFSVLIDQFGWFGFEQHDASLPRLVGCGLLLGGVALLSKY